MPTAFHDETADRLVRLLGETPDTGSVRGPGVGHSRGVVLVRCDSATAADPADVGGVGEQCYPGTIVDQSGDSEAQDEFDEVWLTLMDGGGFVVPTEGAVYLCLVTGPVDIGGDDRTRCIGGSAAGGGDWFWAQITGGTDAGGYSWKRKYLSAAATWTDATSPAPLTGTANAYRPPSVVTTSIPAIPSGQVVLIRRSPTLAGKFEVSPWGGRQTVTHTLVTDVSATCEGGSIVLTKTTKVLTITGRDIATSLV